jgi:DNA segregation ATPase FtsK/SpoIIIE-like protein
MIRPPQEHSLIALDHEVYKDFKVPLAMAEEEELLEWWVAVQAHLMVVGGTGSGKTVLLHGATQRVTQAGWRTWVIDGKRIEFIGFRGWPNVEIVAARIEHQVRAVLAAHELMEERYSRVEVGEASLADFEPLLLVIDELTTFLKRAERWWKKVKPKGAPVKPPVLELIADIARLGRSAKIHMIVGLQRPDVEFVGGEMRDNFGARVSMGRLSPQGAMMMWDSAAIGVSIPRTARGRAICLNSQSRPVEAQTFFAPNPDPNSPGYDQDFVNSVRPKATLYSRKMIEVLEAKEDIDGEIIPLTFDDYADAEIIEYDAEYEKLHARIPDNDRKNPGLSTKALPPSGVPAETEDSTESDPEDPFQ